MTEWQPIETAPKDGSEILVYIDGLNFKGYNLISWDKENNFWLSGKFDRWNESSILGWMPLPEPPVKLHFCGVGYLKPYICKEKEGYFYVSSSGTNLWNLMVKYCPFCGEKAPRYQDEN